MRGLSWLRLPSECTLRLMDKESGVPPLEVYFNEEMLATVGDAGRLSEFTASHKAPRPTVFQSLTCLE